MPVVLDRAWLEVSLPVSNNPTERGKYQSSQTLSTTESEKLVCSKSAFRRRPLKAGLIPGRWGGSGGGGGEGVHTYVSSVPDFPVISFRLKILLFVRKRVASLVALSLDL